MRVGIGYDIHRFIGRGPLRLGGVTIPHARGLAGHSDADVLLHAIADALFGAIGAPDLGEQFPPSDPRTRGADSRLFVRRALAAVRRRGLAVGNLDATVIAQMPRLGPYKARMAREIAKLLGLRDAGVSVKAKTTEGFTPGRAGIAAQAVVLLRPARRPSASGSGTPSPTRLRRVPGLGRRGR
jgi:2-C-methyl-D-erythritol 2,4-cyclodiphosphate synthase